MGNCSSKRNLGLPDNVLEVRSMSDDKRGEKGTMMVTEVDLIYTDGQTQSPLAT